MYRETKNIKNYRPDRVFKQFDKFTKQCKYRYSPLTFSFYLLLISSLRYYLKEGFEPYEVFQLGLRLSLRSDENSNKYISQSKLDDKTNALNPRDWLSMVHNKEIFCKICKKLNLPIPEIYAIILKNKTGISYLNSSFIKREDLVKFIREGLPYEFVTKPTLGYMGRFINVYIKTNNGIIDEFGNLRTEQEILQSIVNNKIYQSFIVQERLRNHEYLLKIHPSENLHTIRIITLIDSSGQFKILHGHLNLGTGQNFAAQLGDLKVSISLNDGSLEYGIYIDKNKGGFIKIDKHPETGRNFTRFKIPLWKEILSFTEKAASEFLPLRTLGWDFAITEKGVKLLEANQGYGSPNFFKSIEKFKDAFFLITSPTNQ